MQFVSFVTKDTPYAKVVEEFLIPSLKKWGLSYDIAYIENRGSWVRNIQYKSQLIKSMLLKHKCPIVSLDADAVIEKDPILFKNLQDYDYACHYYDWSIWYNKPKGSRKEMLGGTQYYAYNQKVLNLVDKWIEEQKKSSIWAQKVLEKILQENKDIKIYELPVEYCFIKTSKHPEIRKRAVIFHNQLSRKYRTKTWKII